MEVERARDRKGGRRGRDKREKTGKGKRGNGRKQPEMDDAQQRESKER